MTKDEQKEYKNLIKEELHKKEGKLVTRPSDHNVYRACRNKPNWARFIFIHSIYDDLNLLDTHLTEKHGYTSLEWKDLTSTYRKHCPVPVEGTKRKRAEE
ncbi:hypothetical protein HDV62DRAFT_355134 [Trichoderma sp. SZMC 28011]